MKDSQVIINRIREIIVMRSKPYGIMDKEELKEVFCRCFKLPKKIHNELLKELTQYGLIIQVNRGRGGIKFRILGD